jgi:hypothetical protein
MDTDRFFKIDLERDIKILLSHYRHHQVLGQGDDDILNAVFVGSIVKGRLFLDMLGFKADKDNQSLFEGKVNTGDINARSLEGRLATKTDLKTGEEKILYNFLTSVNKAEAHRMATTLITMI